MSIDASHWDETSTKGLANYLELEGSQMTVWKKGGYGNALKLLLNQMPGQTPIDISQKLMLGKEVEKINWIDPTNVSVTCTDGTRYFADQIIVTVSLGVLKSKPTLFEPDLPSWKKNAIEGLSFGTVDKIFIKFPHKWWPDECPGINFIWTKEDEKKLFKTVGGVNGRPWIIDAFGFYVSTEDPLTLLGWVCGPSAQYMETLSDEQVEIDVMKLFKHFLTPKFTIPEPERVLKSTWGTNKHFKGSYSSRTLATEKLNTTSEVLGQPIKVDSYTPILFAGEATSERLYSTVHGAIETGWREANRIIETNIGYSDCIPIDVVIIGAGIAGLGASLTFLENDFKNFILLEAQNDPGGRIKSIHIGNNVYLEEGAQWIHGQNNPLYNIAHQYNLTSDVVSDEAQGHYIREDGYEFPLDIIHEVAGVVGDILEKCEDFWTEKIEIYPKSIGHYLDEEFENYLKLKKYNQQEIIDRKQLFDWHRRFQIVDNSCMSLYNLSAKVWGSYKFCGGKDYINLNLNFNSVIKTIINQIPINLIQMNCPVDKILWNNLYINQLNNQINYIHNENQLIKENHNNVENTIDNNMEVTNKYNENSTYTEDNNIVNEINKEDNIKNMEGTNNLNQVNMENIFDNNTKIINNYNYNINIENNHIRNIVNRNTHNNNDLKETIHTINNSKNKINLKDIKQNTKYNEIHQLKKDVWINNDKNYNHSESKIKNSNETNYINHNDSNITNHKIKNMDQNSIQTFSQNVFNNTEKTTSINQYEKESSEISFNENIKINNSTYQNNINDKLIKGDKNHDIISNHINNEIKEKVQDINYIQNQTYQNIYKDKCNESIKDQINVIHEEKDQNEINKSDELNKETNLYKKINQYDSPEQIVGDINHIDLTYQNYHTSQSNNKEHKDIHRDQIEVSKHDKLNENSNLNKTDEIIVKCSNGTIYRTKYIIVTPSLGYLKENHKNMFKPNLPNPWNQAITHMGFCSIVKIFLIYDKPWWNKDEEGFQFIWKNQNLVNTINTLPNNDNLPNIAMTNNDKLPNNENLPNIAMTNNDILPNKKITNTDKLPNISKCSLSDSKLQEDPNISSTENETKSNEIFDPWLKEITGFDVLSNIPFVLLGWLGGPYVEEVENLKEEEIGEKCTKLLKHFTKFNIPKPVKVVRSTWSQNKYIRGGYSHTTSACDELNINLRDLSTPIPINKRDGIYFAGEALHEQYFSTVHGAFLSGVEQAEKILHQLNYL